MPIFHQTQTCTLSRAAGDPDHMAFCHLGTRPYRETPIGLGGFNHLFMAIDKFTKWIEDKPMTTVNAENAIEFIWEIIHRYGVMNTIITNKGT